MAIAMGSAGGGPEKVLSNAVVASSGQRNAIILAAVVSVAALELEHESLTARRV